MLYNVYNGTGSKTGHDMTFNDQNWGIFGRVGYPMAGICKQASEPPCMVYRSFLYFVHYPLFFGLHIVAVMIHEAVLWALLAERVFLMRRDGWSLEVGVCEMCLCLSTLYNIIPTLTLLTLLLDLS